MYTTLQSCWLKSKRHAHTWVVPFDTTTRRSCYLSDQLSPFAYTLYMSVGVMIIFRVHRYICRYDYFQCTLYACTHADHFEGTLCVCSMLVFLRVQCVCIHWYAGPLKKTFCMFVGLFWEYIMCVYWSAGLFLFVFCFVFRVHCVYLLVDMLVFYRVWWSLHTSGQALWWSLSVVLEFWDLHVCALCVG